MMIVMARGIFMEIVKRRALMISMNLLQERDIDNDDNDDEILSSDHEFGETERDYYFG